jgi:hypothetical protein
MKLGPTHHAAGESLKVGENPAYQYLFVMKS